MAKAFYAVQKHTNTLMQWNGAWSALDAPAGTVPAVQLRHGQLFEFQGKLRMLYVDTVALKVATWDVGSQLWINETVFQNGSNLYLISNVLVYKGKLLIMGRYNNTAWSMWTWDGTTVTEVTDAGLLTLLMAVTSIFNLWPDSLCPTILPHKHQLIYAQHSVTRDTSGGAIACSQIYRLDSEAVAGQSGAQWLFGPRVGSAIEGNYGPAAVRLNTADMNVALANNYVMGLSLGVGIWRDRLFMLRYDGWLCELNADTGAVTKQFDFRNHPGLAITGQAFTSTHDGSVAGAGFAVGRGSVGLDLTKFRGFPHGARVDVGGSKYAVGAIFSGTNDYLGLVDSDGNVLPSQPAGTDFTIETKGLIPCQIFYTPHAGFLADVQMVEVGDFLYIIYGARDPNIVSIPEEEKNGLLITKWNVVTDAKTHFTITHPITGLKPNISSLNVDFDPETGRLMILWADSTPTPDSWYYVAWDTATDTIENASDFFAFGGSDSDSSYAQGPQALLAFVEGQPGVVIDSVSYDEADAKTTIGYTIYNPGDEVVDVTVEFTRGNGVWAACTRKGTEGEGVVDLAAAEAGSAHTFVHDLIADAPGFAGKVQYRIRVAE